MIPPAHVAGIPVEETLPGVLALGVLGVRVASHYLHQGALRLRSRRGGTEPGSGGQAP